MTAFEDHEIADDSHPVIRRPARKGGFKVLSVPEDLRALGVTDIVAIDTEFVHRRGERVTPVCICGKSLVHGKEWQLFNDGSHQLCPVP